MTISERLGSDFISYYYPTTVAIYETIDLTPESDIANIAISDMIAFRIESRDNTYKMFNLVLLELILSFANTDMEMETLYEAIIEEINCCIFESLVGEQTFKNGMKLFNIEWLTSFMINLNKYVSVHEGNFEMLFVGWLRRGGTYDAGFIFI